MKTSRAFLFAGLGLFLSIATSQFSSSLAQGSLNPPGAPGPTMKSLDQIASTGIAINATNTQPDANYEYVIAQSGSYYLTANLGVGKANGIHVTAPNVTIDLNGFQISRGAGGGDGITIDPTAHGCVVKNGSIKGFSYGINAVLSNGTPLVPAYGGSFIDLTVSNCTTYGLLGGRSWVIDRCKAYQNNGSGAAIYAWEGSTLSNCTAANNTIGNAIQGLTGSSFINCVASNNTAIAGINAAGGSTLINCVASNNTSASSVSDGFVTGGGCTIIGCSAVGNTNTNATATINTGVGIGSGGGSVIRNCDVRSNKGDGIQVDNACLIMDNSISSNGAGGTSCAGIHITGNYNRVEGNHVTGNVNDGISVNSSPKGVHNVIVRNSAAGNGNFQFRVPGINGTDQCCVGDNVIGPFVDYNFSTSNPWANFTNY